MGRIMNAHATTITKATPKAPILSRHERRRLVQNDGVERVTLSFYRYVRIADPEVFRAELLMRWGQLGCLGRIYVAKEGINAQMNVPKANWDAFDTYTQSLPELSEVPYKIAVAEGAAPSFYKLSIKVRPKIVADGLDDESFDVTNTGQYLTAKELNEYIDDPEAVVVDMRNAYESEVGHFEDAVTPDVDTFREELAVAPELLRVHKNKKIALYCTGGIRCEKASAWLKHNGFQNVRHLKGGIIEYAHQVKERGLPNKFKGSNFVFDERLGERVGEEVISYCHICREAKTDQYQHCANQICHELFLGCPDCVTRYKNCCSRRCQLINQLPPAWKKSFARVYNHYRRSRRFKKARLRRA